MTTLFISDLHLSPERPEIIRLFVDFLTQETAGADALYILGDLFEYWIGDDYIADALRPVLAQLQATVAAGVPVFVMRGNRDFLLGDGFERASGCQLLADPALITLYGVPTLLMHGDSLCTDDVEYQKFRQQSRNPEWQRQILALPVEQRIALAERLRAQSKQETSLKAEYIMDVNMAEVDRVMRHHGVTRLIHGHTHRPAVHSLTHDEQAATRIVLGDWYEHGSVLRCHADGTCLLAAI